MAEETVRIQAVVLDRKPFREHDLLVTVYSRERGREQLIAKGARKFRSKIAAHVEPFCFIEGMVVCGKRQDYLGSALSSECFAGIKSDLDRLAAASEAVIFFREMIRPNEADLQVMGLLVDFLAYMNSAEQVHVLSVPSFKFKLLKLSGVAMDLQHCQVCGQKLIEGGSRFGGHLQGLAHQACLSVGLTVSDDCIKIMRTVNVSPFSEIGKIKASQRLHQEFIEVIRQFAGTNRS